MDFKTRLRSFPWKVARSHLLRQIVGFVIGLALTIYLIRQGAIAAGLTAEHLGLFDEHLTWVFALTATLGLGWFFITTYWVFRPMAYLVRSMRGGAVHHFRSAEGSAQDDIATDGLFVDEPGEWSDLDRMIGQMARRLKDRESDISREREELVTILSSVNDAIVAMGSETEPLYFNSRFAVLFGAGASEGKALPLKERFRIPELLDGFERVLREGRTRTFRVRIRTEIHLSERDFSVSVSPLILRETAEFSGYRERPTVYGAVAVFHDISELRQTEQMRMDFVANASHELKTPLTSIKGFVDATRAVLTEGPLGPAEAAETGQHLGVVARNVDRLIALVHDLLELAALESGAEIKKTILNPLEITEATLRLLEGRKPSFHPIRVECSVDRLLGDERRIEQVLLNLIDNATKYSSQGSEIRVVWEKGEGAHAGDTVLRVQDSGPGIADEHLPRLFERFYRVDGGRAREVGGTGLGLAIVKHIVLSHGGSIAVRSQLGKGSEFLCRFPNK